MNVNVEQHENKICKTCHGQLRIIGRSKMQEPYLLCLDCFTASRIASQKTEEPERARNPLLGSIDVSDFEIEE